MTGLLDQLLSFVRDMDPLLRTLAAGAAIMLETSILVGLLVPGDSIVLVAASGVRGPGQWLGMIVAVLLGSLAGESFGFWLGRLFGPRIRASRPGRWIGPERWRAAERLLDRRGGAAIFASRFLPVLHSLVPLTVGMSRFSYVRFLKWTAPACLLWASAYTSVSASAALGYEQLSDSLHSAGALFAAIILLFLACVWLGKRLVHRSMRRDMEETGPVKLPAADADGEGGRRDEACADGSPASGACKYGA
ncbi:MAG: DedA family protein [Pseudoclavibacter sp.]|nr:DedA family protein [Pseudoclavibacter sp.]